MTKANRRLLAAALMAGMAFLSSIYALQGPLLNSMIDHFGLTDSAQGLASSASSVGGVIALLTSFLMIGRLPKLTLFRIALGVCAVFLALLKFAPVFALFVALWLALGVGMGYVDMLVSSCMADLYEGRAATQMMCFLHMTYGVASIICPILYSGAMGAGMMWNSLYLCVSVLALLLLAYTTFAVRRASRGGAKALAAENRMSLKQMGGVIRKGALPGLIVAMFCHGMFLGGLNTWINRYVGVTLNSSMGALALSCMFVGVMTSRLLVPFMPFTPERYVRVGGLLAGAVLLAALPLQNGTVVCVAVCFSGLFFGAMIPCLLNIGCAETPESTMLATTLLMLSLFVAQAITSPLIGALESAVSLHAGIAMCGVFMVLASLCCIPTLKGRK